MDDVTQTKQSRLWKVVLAVSLALNLAVVGLVVGVALSGRFGDGPPRSFDFGLGPVSRALDRDERREIGVALRRDRALRDFDQRARATALITALRAQPFDPEAVRTVVEEQNMRVAALQQRAQAVLIDQIAQMTPERRASFADQLQEEFKRGRKPRD